MRWRNGGYPAYCAVHAAKKPSRARRACLRTSRTHTQRETAESIRAAQHPRQSGMARRESPTRNETAIATANSSHSAQQLRYSGGRIVMGHSVTPGNQGKAILTLPSFNQAMDKEALTAQKENDVAR